MCKETLSFSSNNLETYLNTISFPKHTKEKSKTLDGEITENELFIALQSTENNKSPGNDGLTKEVYITFWNEIKTPLLLAIETAYLVKQLSTSQKQAVIKLIEKKGRDKRYIQNWRPISLLNVDVKLISKALAEHLKNVLPEITSPNQNAYVKNRCISEGGRLISDLLEMSEVLNEEGFLVTIDIEKAFDSVNLHFLIAILEKIGFGTEFIEWIKVLLNNQESCVINGGKTLKYFKLERGTRQGDPISAYLFIIVLEVVFRIIKETSNIEGFEIFQKKFIYTAYADDTTFFLKNTESVINLLEIFKHFSHFSGLKPNKSKCEIAGIGVLKGVKVALCGMRCVNLHEDAIKILRIHYSYNKQLENDENFKKYIEKIENVLKLWRARNLSLDEKIAVFKSLALSKITHLALVKTIPPTIIDQLNKTQKNLIWNGLSPKIKNSTINNNYENGGLKNVNIAAKISSLQSSWIKILFNENFHV